MANCSTDWRNWERTVALGLGLAGKLRFCNRSPMGHKVGKPSTQIPIWISSLALSNPNSLRLNLESRLLFSRTSMCWSLCADSQAGSGSLSSAHTCSARHNRPGTQVDVEPRLPVVGATATPF